MWCNVLDKGRDKIKNWKLCFSHFKRFSLPSVCFLILIFFDHFFVIILRLKHAVQRLVVCACEHTILFLFSLPHSLPRSWAVASRKVPVGHGEKSVFYSKITEFARKREKPFLSAITVDHAAKLLHAVCLSRVHSPWTPGGLGDDRVHGYTATWLFAFSSRWVVAILMSGSCLWCG